MNHTQKYRLMNNMTSQTMAEMLELCKTTEELLKLYHSFDKNFKKNPKMVD